jgi:hypothetical protein
MVDQVLPVGAGRTDLPQPDKERTDMKTRMKIPKFKRDIAAMLKELKSTIGDEFRATDEDTRPSMCVTIACDDAFTKWACQTGDNSYSGACYHLPHWAVVYLYRNSNCRSLASDAVNELLDAIPPRYSVTVGNVGMVWDGETYKTALVQFKEWKNASRSGSGRAADESVTLFDIVEGEPVKEYWPKEVEA